MGIKAIRQTDYMILLCQDMSAMRDFYLNILRFALEDDHEDWVVFRTGNQRLTLRPRGPWLTWDDGDMPAGSASVHLAFCVGYGEVSRCHDELVEQGVEIIDPPKDQDFGHRTLFFRDPDGNVLEIFAEL